MRSRYAGRDRDASGRSADVGEAYLLVSQLFNALHCDQHHYHYHLRREHPCPQNRIPIRLATIHQLLDEKTRQKSVQTDQKALYFTKIKPVEI